MSIPFPGATIARAAVLAEDCAHCGAKAGLPCSSFGAAGGPMPQGYEFHTQRVHAALFRRNRRACAVALALLCVDDGRGTSHGQALLAEYGYRRRVWQGATLLELRSYFQ